jgi:hypothetical protein
LQKEGKTRRLFAEAIFEAEVALSVFRTNSVPASYDNDAGTLFGETALHLHFINQRKQR